MAAATAELSYSKHQMRSSVLAKAELVTGGWIGKAYGSEGIIAIGAAPTEEQFIARIRTGVEDYLVTNAAHWLNQMQYAESPKVPHCPEGAIKLPVDIWVCKIVRQICPIQAQVFVDDPEKFSAGCLADEERKWQIFNTTVSGEYGGFHHAKGRYLCVRCDDERGSQTSFSYHYPWELSSLEDFAPFVLERDMPDVLRKLIGARIPRSAVLNALCARHSIEIAELLYPDVGAKLRILEFEISRPIQPAHGRG